MDNPPEYEKEYFDDILQKYPGKTDPKDIREKHNYLALRIEKLEVSIPAAAVITIALVILKHIGVL